MNITEILGQPVRQGAEPIAVAGSRCPAQPPAEPPTEMRQSGTRKGFRKTRGALAALGLLITGLGFGRLLVPSPADAESPVVQPLPAASIPAPAADFAMLFTSLHLTGLTSAADMASMYPAATPGPTATGMWINREAVVAARRTHEDLWEVTVVVDAMELVEGAYEPAGLQYYTVTVDTAGDHPTAVALPARVPGPTVAHHSLATPSFDGDLPPDQAEAVAGFLDAYLTGQGEVARFAATNAQIPRFEQAPYAAVDVAAAGSDELGRVHMTIEAVTENGGRHRLEYTLETTFERGVWEVSKLVAAAPRNR